MRRALEDEAGYSWGGQTDSTPGSSQHTTHAKTKTSIQAHHTSNDAGTSSQGRMTSFTCPLILFRKDLLMQLNEWQMAGDKIILFMDHNKHMTEGALGKALGVRDGLDLHEAIIHHTGKSPGATFFRGSKPIGGLWVSGNIDISNACVMPFGYGVGDHRAYILDIPIESLVGIDPVKIVQPAS
jgi:hypothetical protein